MTTDIYTLLAEPFAPEMERELVKSGTRLTYIPVSEVINRMNTVLGVENWSSEVIDVRRDPIDPDFVVAHVRVSAMVNGVTVVKDGLGGQTIKRKKSGEIVDLGDEFKGAVSDAFKKACSMFGVALYLSRSDEAIEAELAMQLSPEPPVATINAESATLFATLRTHLDRMDSTAKTEIKQWWMNEFPGANPPSPGSDPDHISAAIAWCVEKAFRPEQGAA